MSGRSVIQYYNEGLGHAKAKNWDKALEFLERAIDEDPGHVNSYNVLGKVYIQKGDFSTARKCWRKALKLDPGNVTAKNCLNALRNRSARFETTTLLWMTAVFVLLAALIITNILLLSRIGSLETELELATGGTSEIEAASQGEHQAQSVILNDDSDVEVSSPADAPKIETSSQVTQEYDLAMTDCRSERYARAIQRFRRILTYPSFHQLKDNAQYWLAECYYAQRKYDRALTEFQKVRRQFPRANKVFDAELKIAYTYHKMGRIHQAEQKLSQLSQEWPGQEYQSKIAILRQKISSRQSE